MGALDLFFLIVVALSVILGMWRGLVYEVLSVGGWVLAFFAAQRYGHWVGALLPLNEVAEPLRMVVGFVAVFVAVAFLAAGVAWLSKLLIQSAGMRPVDRMLGGAFGVMRAVFLLLALAMVVQMTPLKQNEHWQTSRGAVWLERGLLGLKDWMPSSWGQYIS